MRDSIKEKHFQHRSQKFYSAEFNKVNSVLKYKCSILISQQVYKIRENVSSQQTFLEKDGCRVDQHVVFRVQDSICDFPELRTFIATRSVPSM